MATTTKIVATDVLPPAEVMHALTERAAVNDYLEAAHAIGLLKGQEGHLRVRLRSIDPHNHRGAMAELIAAWWLSRGLGLKLTPRPAGVGKRVLEFGIEHAGETFGVEVKAPFRPQRYRPGTTYVGPVQSDHIGAVVTCLGAAHQQFDPTKRNIVVLCPYLDWGIRPAVMDALEESPGLAIDAVMVIHTLHDWVNPDKDRPGEGFVQHSCYVVRNRRRNPPPDEMWGRWPVYEGQNQEPWKEPVPVSGSEKREWVRTPSANFTGFEIHLVPSR